jgi:hypothetical protein
VLGITAGVHHAGALLEGRDDAGFLDDLGEARDAENEETARLLSTGPKNYRT